MKQIQSENINNNTQSLSQRTHIAIKSRPRQPNAILTPAMSVRVKQPSVRTPRIFVVLAPAGKVLSRFPLMYRLIELGHLLVTTNWV